MAAPPSGGNRYYYRESKLVTTDSDSEEDAYEVPPELDSDSGDSEGDSDAVDQAVPTNSRARSVPDTKAYVDDSLPSNSSVLMLSKPYTPARKSDSDGNIKRHLIEQDYKSKQTAMVQPVRQPEVPRHTQTRPADGRVNIGKVL